MSVAQSGSWEPSDAGSGRMHEDDPRWHAPGQPHGLTRLNRDDSDFWKVRGPGERWAGATVQRWCEDCRGWTHVVDAGVPVDWDADDRCATCSRSFPLDPTV